MTFQTEEIQVIDDPRKRTCDHCGNEYAFKSSRSKYCSERCRGLGNAAKRKGMNGPTDDNEPDDNNQSHQHDDDADYSNGAAVQLRGNLRGARCAESVHHHSPADDDQ